MESQVPLLVAFGAGILSVLSPCVLPILPSFVSYITGLSIDQAGNLRGSSASGLGMQSSRVRALTHATFFILGFSVIFLALGWTASLVGQLFWTFQVPLRRLGGVLVIALGLFLLGWLRIPGLDRDLRVHMARRPTGLLGSALIGMAFAAGWTPCIGPTLASILVLAGTSPGRAVYLMAAYAFGVAIPFLGLAAGIGSVGWLRPYAGTMQRVAGGLLVVMGFLLVTGTMNRITSWLLQWFGPIGI